jgi:putative ABC transport system permease protein
VVERTVTLADDPATALRIDGIDALKAVRVTPLLIGRSDAKGDDASPSATTLDWFDADALQVAPSLLTALHKSIGDALTVRVDGQPVTLRIAGRLDDAIDDASPATSGAPRTAQAVMDIAGAQWRLGRLGRLSRIDLRLAEGSDAVQVRDTLVALLPPEAEVTSAADDRARTGDLSRAYRVNLDMLALMALFTGAFLVYSTQSLAVARRRAQLALLRVIGATRRRVIGQVLVEGLLQGLVGGLVGLAGGIGFAALALRFFGGDLGGGYFTGAPFDFHRLLFAAPDAALLFFALGLAAALVGSFFPARAAARAAPAVALKSAGGDVGTGHTSPWAAAALIGAGIACALLPPIGGLPIAGYVAMALLLFGGIAAMPWIAQRLLAPFGAGGGAHGIAFDLALRRLRAAPSAASVALCGIVASASLMVAMTVMIASFRHSVDAWLGQLLSADVYLRTNAPGEGLAPLDVDRLRHVDGIARVDLQKVVPLALSPTRPAVSLIVRTIDTTQPSRGLPLIRETAIDAGDGTIPVWVSEAMVDLYGARLGEPLALPLSDARYRVVGVWRDYARQFGSVVMRRDDYVRATHDERFTDAAITLVPGTTADGAIDRLRRALPDALRPRAEFAEPAAIRKLSLDIFDRSFAVTYLLQAVAIAIGLAGVAATFSAQTLARAKEFGMLRHIGVLRRQIVAELADEGALLGTLGALAGGLLGLAMSQVLIHVVNPQSFHWTMDTEVPWGTLAAVGAALIAASAGTAVLAGRRALTHDAVLAVREDW